MTWIDCDSTHLEAIRAIFNDAIAQTTALYDHEPRSPEFMTGWWRTKREGDFPVIGVVDEAGTLLGFGTYGTFRAFAGYRYTVEHSVYMVRQARGRGLGKELLARLVERATAQGYHVMVGVIDASNETSIALHRRLGFEECGRIRESGWKFGRWLDVAFYQRVLSSVESEEG